MNPFTSFSSIQFEGHSQRPREWNVGEGDDYRAREADFLNQIECASKRKHRLLGKVKRWIISQFEQA